EPAIPPLPPNPPDRVVPATPRSPSRESFLGEGVRFASGSADISPGSEEVLESIFLKLILMANDVEVIGYTDGAGDPGENLRLSLARAEAVKRWLLAKGMPKHRITAAGRGSANPIAPNDTPRGRGQNRRIEIHIIPTGRNSR
ncbi:MAG: OmpA family protein, partial [Ignavibacteria bacterium]|nr:OmpA family protein [Ignavibacteria bacterium]